MIYKAFAKWVPNIGAQVKDSDSNKRSNIKIPLTHNPICIKFYFGTLLFGQNRYKKSWDKIDLFDVTMWIQSTL